MFTELAGFLCLALAQILPEPFPWGLSMAAMPAEVSDGFAPEVRGDSLPLNRGYGFCSASLAEDMFWRQGSGAGPLRNATC